MSQGRPSSTEGYADEAEILVRQYETISFVDVHRPMWTTPSLEGTEKPPPSRAPHRGMANRCHR